MREADRNGRAGSVFSGIALIGTGVMALFLGANIYYTYGPENLKISALLLAVFLVLLFFFGFLTVRFSPLFLSKRRRFVPLLLELSCLALFGVIGLKLRISGLDPAADSLAAELEKVYTGKDYVSSSLDYVYQTVCSFFYFLMGKKAVVSGMAGIFTEYFACVSACLLARRIGGRLSGISTFVILMLLPTQYGNPLLSGKELLAVGWMLFTIWLFLAYAATEENEEKAFCQVIFCLLMSIAAGFCVFLQPFFLVLPVSFCIYLISFLKRKDPHPCVQGLIRWVLCLVLTGITFLGLMLAKACDLQLRLEAVLSGYLVSVLPDSEILSFSPVQAIWRAWIPSDYTPWLQSICLALLILGSVALLFFTVENDNRCFPLTFPVSGLWILFSMKSSEACRIEYFLFFAVILTGTAFCEICHHVQIFLARPRVQEETIAAEEENLPEEEYDTEPAEYEEAEEIEKTEEIMEEPVKRKVPFLENPLPEPKRHVPKELDYDISVEDEDDFDI